MRLINNSSSSLVIDWFFMVSWWLSSLLNYMPFYCLFILWWKESASAPAYHLQTSLSKCPWWGWQPLGQILNAGCSAPVRELSDQVSLFGHLTWGLDWWPSCSSRGCRTHKNDPSSIFSPRADHGGRVKIMDYVGNCPSKAAIHERPFCGVHLLSL